MDDMDQEMGDAVMADNNIPLGEYNMDELPDLDPVPGPSSSGDTARGTYKLL
jgi:hypothetical protein